MTASRTRALLTAVAIAAATAAIGAGSAAGMAGGLGTPSPPQVRDVVCASGCLDVRNVAVGGKIEVSGRALAAVEEISFAGGSSVEPRKATDSRLIAKVPRGAKDGTVTVRTSSGQSTHSTAELEVSGAKALQADSGFEVTRAVATPSKAYFDNKRRSAVEYIFKGKSAVDVRIDVVSARGGEVVDTIVQKNRKPFTTYKARWNGLDSNNRIPRRGKYQFKVAPLGTADGRAGSARFKYYDHIFPVRARKVSFGDGLGAGRNHQGQDVFARCGTKIVAARGGRVQESKYHSAAGYYVVIDGARTKQDYAYMHLEKRGRPKVGDRVRTGERIGFTSDTGRASGCHLHFELWSAPGWYEGGSPLSPTRLLKRWNKYS